MHLILFDFSLCRSLAAASLLPLVAVLTLILPDAAGPCRRLASGTPS